MRGINDTQSYMFTYISPDERVPAEHPLRQIKAFADKALKELSPVFNRMYSRMGRPSIPPERLLKAQILIALYSVRSDRLFAEMLDYNILFRWFLDMNLEEPSLDATTFTKNRDRLLEHNVAVKFFDKVVRQARKEGLLSDEHFTVDGTLIEACASIKSFRPKDEDPTDRPTTDDDRGNPSVNFRGEKRTNETHCSTTDPEALLMRKARGKEARLSYSAHALMENRNGLLVDLGVAYATGKSERQSALAMLGRQGRKRVKPRTLGADKGYDTRDFVDRLRGKKITPHVAANVERKGGSAIDCRTTRHAGYAVSQRIRKRVEEIFGWLKAVGGFRRTRFKGRDRTELQALFVGTAYNLLRMTKLTGKKAAVA
jgi:transposase